MWVEGAGLRTNSGRRAAGRPANPQGTGAGGTPLLQPRQLPRALCLSQIVSFLRSLKQVVRACPLQKGWGSRNAWTCFHAGPAHCLGFISPRSCGVSSVQCLRTPTVPFVLGGGPGAEEGPSFAQKTHRTPSLQTGAPAFTESLITAWPEEVPAGAGAQGACNCPRAEVGFLGGSLGAPQH